MGKVSKWFEKWGFIIALGFVGVTLLFALGACIYTSIINPFVGITGVFGVAVALGIDVYVIWQEVTDAIEEQDVRY